MRLRVFGLLSFILNFKALEITFDKKGAVEASIKVSIFEEDYQQKVADKIKNIAKKANINGFRPGKVPAGIIKMRHGREVLIEELNELINDALKNYINEHELKIIGGPIPTKSMDNVLINDSKKDFDFSFDFGLRDDFELDISKNIKIDRYTIKIEKENVKEWVNKTRLDYSETDYADISEAGDELYLKLEPISNDFSSDVSIFIDEVSENLKEKFIGREIDDVIEFEFDDLFENDYYKKRFLDYIEQKNHNKLTGTFKVTVLEIMRRIPAPLNQKLFDDVLGKGIVNNEEEFMSKSKEIVSKQYKAETEMFMKYSIKQYFIKNTKIEIPHKFFRRWLVVSSEGKLTEESVEHGYDFYEERMRWSLIQSKIADKYGIKVDESEVIGTARDMIASYYTYNTYQIDEETLNEYTRNYLERNDGEKYNELYLEIYEEKIFNAIKDYITLVDKEISYDEFSKFER